MTPLHSGVQKQVCKNRFAKTGLQALGGMATVSAVATSFRIANVLCKVCLHCVYATCVDVISCHRISSHYITSHHNTSHHISSHHITSHRITSHRITVGLPTNRTREHTNLTRERSTRSTRNAKGRTVNPHGRLARRVLPHGSAVPIHEGEHV